MAEPMTELQFYGELTKILGDGVHTIADSIECSSTYSISLALEEIAKALNRIADAAHNYINASLNGDFKRHR